MNFDVIGKNHLLNIRAERFKFFTDIIIPSFDKSNLGNICLSLAGQRRDEYRNSASEVCCNDGSGGERCSAFDNDYSSVDLDSRAHSLQLFDITETVFVYAFVDIACSFGKT